jgi:hypothetical protein
MFSKVPETQTAPVFDFRTASCTSKPGFPPTNPTGSSFMFGASHEATGSSLPKKEPLVFATSQINMQSESFMTRIQQLETKVKALEQRSLLCDTGKHDKDELLALFQNYMVAAFKLVNCLFSMAIAKIGKLRHTEKAHASQVEN